MPKFIFVASTRQYLIAFFCLLSILFPIFSVGTVDNFLLIKREAIAENEVEPLESTFKQSLLPSSRLFSFPKGNSSGSITFNNFKNEPRTNPSLGTTISEPDDIVYELGTTGHEINWTIFADSAISGSYKVLTPMGITGATGTFGQTNLTVTQSIDGLGLGTYAFQLNVSIVFGDIFTNDFDAVMVSVGQILERPTNLQATIANANVTLTWNEPSNIDLFPVNYTVERSRENQESFTVLQTGVTDLNFTDTSIIKGVTYFYRVKAVNFFGSSLQSDSVSINVKTVPGSQFDLRLIANSTGVVILWDILLDDGGAGLVSYAIEKSNKTDGSSIQSPFVEIAFGLSGLSYFDVNIIKGATYFYRVKASNAIGSGLFSTEESVEIETIVPSLISSGNRVIELGSDALISWGLSDEHPNSYTLTYNGTIVQQDMWPTDMLVTKSLSSVNLTLGVHIFTIIASDIFGNSASNSIRLDVVDTMAPTLSDKPDDIVIGLRDQVYLNWTALDLDPGSYNISMGGTEAKFSEIWESGTLIQYGVSVSLVPGVYNFTINIFDGSGNSVDDSVIVTVENTLQPRFEFTPSDKILTEGTTGEQMDWIVIDAINGSFKLFQNGKVSTTGSFTTIQMVEYSLDELSEGSYNFTLEITGQYGKSATDQVTVIVVAQISSTNSFEFSLIPLFIGLAFFLLLVISILVGLTIIGNDEKSVLADKETDKKGRERI